MAPKTSDLSDSQLELSTRSARFHERPAAERGADAPTETGDERRANLEPPASIAPHREVVEQFRDELLEEGARRDDATGEAAVAMQAVVLAEEALGEFDPAARRIHALAQLREPTVADRRLYRRLLRATGERGPLMESLEHSVREADEPEATLLAVEGAWQAWRRGHESTVVATWLDRARASGALEETAWSEYRRHQIQFDTCVEAGDREGAERELRRHLETTDSRRLEGLAETRLAIWRHLRGDPHEAAGHLARRLKSRDLDGDLDELLVHLAWEIENRELAEAAYEVRVAERGGLPHVWAVPHALRHGADASSETGAGLEALRRATDRTGDDATTAGLRARLLEDAFDADSDETAVDAVIAALNSRLEHATGDAERIATLTRLGELYEREALLPEAAADVYREVLELQPDHPAAIRALGRLYARQQNWRALAELYEHELRELEFSDRKWRHHFRLAELYDDEIGDPEAALTHYRATLEARPNYLPALKATARLLESLERWEAFVDLFLSAVDDAPSRRQKLYLLDRAAEVAEHRLDRPDVAIGAWEEILALDEDHPRVFSALGRLYAETGRWENLVELNLRQIDRLEDDHEAAALYLRSAEICEQQLADRAQTVEFYKRALTLVPDYLPALEGLGRLYAETGRWTEIARMSERELGEMQEGPETTRQLGALAEIVDRQLGRSEEATRLYEAVYRRRPDDEHLRETLLRHRRADGDWEAVVSLLEDRLSSRDDEPARAQVLGELALVEEWRRDNRGRACELFLEALEADPENLHWLDGVQRTWAAADASADEIAARLEDRVVDPLDEQTLERYFQVVARLRERENDGDESESLTSFGHRMHADRDALENQLVLEVAMAESGDRRALVDARQDHPHHPFDSLNLVPRSHPDEADLELLDRQLDRLTDAERRMVAGELPAATGEAFVRPGDAPDLRLSADLQRLLDDRDPMPLDDDPDPPAFPLRRLRAVVADRDDRFRTFKRWTHDELAVRERRDAIVERLVRLSQLARRTDQLGQAAHLNRQAAIVVFPPIRGDGDQLHPSIADASNDSPLPDETIDLLYASLRESGQWELLRTCLEAHVARDGLSSGDRVELFTRLAGVCEQKLDDWEGAIRARTHCWQISEEPAHLEELVRLDEAAGDYAGAIRHQERHYEVMMRRDELGPDAIVKSGRKLAELLLADESRRDEAVATLENLRESFPDTSFRDGLLRDLAYAYCETDQPRAAVDAFQAFLEVEIDEDNLADWRRLVRLHADDLANPEAAYSLQWRILRAFPTSERALDELVELAYGAGDVDNCVERLESMADEASPDERRVLLTRAARVADEHLQMWEAAERLYGRVLDETDPDAEATHDLVRRRVLCLSRLVGREREAVASFGRLLEHDAFEPAAYRAMLDLFERERALDRSRLARQVLDVLNCEIDRQDVRTKTRPSRHFAEEVVDRHLLPEPLDGDVFHLLMQTVPLAEKVWTKELPQKKVLDGRRLPSDHPLEEALEAGAAAFDLRTYTADVGDSGPPAPQVFGADKPDYWFNEQTVSGTSRAEQYFTAGYVSALGWSGLSPLLELDGRQFWHLVEATWLHQTGEGFDERVDVESQRLADEIGSPFLAVTRRRIHNAIEPVAERMPEAACELWPEAVHEFAARAGLVLCGDLAAAIRCLLRFEGWELDFDNPETREQITRMDLLARLVRFAFSEDYLAARYEVGLTANADEISV